MAAKDLFECERDRLKKEITSSFDRSKNPEIMRNEVTASDYDLESARRDLGFKDYKWAIVKAYYSMLHAAKAYVRFKGFIITDHKCTHLYLEKCARNGEFDGRYAAGYKGAKDFRWDADYGLKYDENTANEVISVAADFNNKMKELIGVIK
jgi:uncharacterized protein (UPF0332 family)